MLLLDRIIGGMREERGQRLFYLVVEGFTTSLYIQYDLLQLCSGVDVLSKSFSPYFYRSIDGPVHASTVDRRIWTKNLT
jgi:hypothetical protein